MPTYRIVSELVADRTPRASRGQDVPRRASTQITGDIAAALMRAEADLPDGHRIIAIEEAPTPVVITDEAITSALSTEQDGWIAPDEFEPDETIYDSGSFIYTVHTVAEALNSADLVPGLHISLLQNSSEYVDYSMVEIYDHLRGTYRSRGAELSDLTDDRSATGWDGVLAIARALIDLSSELR